MSEINSIANGTFTIGATSTNDSSLLVTQNEGNVSILSTQQEVSHDYTLSGNGTVDSPLGVVNGYNETVLWSGTLTNGKTANLSESVQNFEKIKVYTHESQRKRNLVSEYETDYFNTQPMIAVCIPDIENADSKSWFALYWSRLYFTDTACSAIVNNGGMQTWWDSKVNAALNVVKDRYCIVDKIVGINRKA